MSRHFYLATYQEEDVTVLMGYDRPLDGFFMVIESSEGNDEEFIYSNLFDEISHPKSIEGYTRKLAELGIEVPPQMIAEVESDGREKVGNKDVYHSIKNGVYSRHEN